MMNGILFWCLLLAVFYAAFALVNRYWGRRAVVALQPPPVIPAERLAAWEAKLAPLMAITSHQVEGEIIEFEGNLKEDAEEAYPRIREAFAEDSVSPLLLEGEDHQTRVLLAPATLVHPASVSSRPNWGLHWLLFLATVATTTWAGALHAGVNLLQEPGRFAVGLPYSLGLLLILGAHELGHYFTAKHHGIVVTPPFFVPVPFALGTFGAFIKIKSLTPNRRALFDVAVAGPLAGLVFAIPAVLIGLRYSQAAPIGTPEALGNSAVNVGSSVLLACLAKLSLGSSVGPGQQLLLHPLAFAGWLGLIVTALNLLPIGQLDGGHISHALFGSRKAHGISMAALVILIFLALFVWPGLLFWAFIVFFIAGTRDSPAANDITPIDAPRRALGYLAFLLLLLIILPVPHAFHQAASGRAPYI